MVVSIVIPCFNRERLLGEAIDSALAQGEDVEVIAIDDGSSDGSWGVIESYGAKILAERQGNKGAGAARNRGLALASGRFVQFLDSDDRMPAGALSRMLAAATSLSEREVATGQIAWMDEGGRLLGRSAVTGAADAMSLLGLFIGSTQPLYPLHALREIGGFDPRFRNHEDHELAVRLMARGYRFVPVPVVTCEARIHDGERLSRARGPGFIQHRLEVLEVITQHVERAGLGPDASAYHARLLWSVARQAARAGERQVAERLFTLAASVAGSRAVTARWPVRAAQRLLGPYRGERLIEGLKRLAGRRG